MKTYRKELSLFIAAVSLSSITLATTPTYSITNLGIISPLAGWSSTPNFSGSFVGSLYAEPSPSNTTHAFYYDGTNHDLGTLGGTNSYAIGINSAKYVVGDSYLADDTTYHAFMYDDTMHDLGTLGGTNSSAWGINANNVAVGYSDLLGDTATHAFLFDGTMHDLGTLGGTSSHAYAINDNNLVVGESNITDDLEAHAFLYDGAMHDLGTLGGAFSAATSISQNGIVAGQSEVAPGSSISHAFLYDGTMHDLGTLGGDISFANSVNNLGWVVGFSSISDSESSAFLFDGSTMHNLNTLLATSLDGITIIDANGIDNNGTIFAVGIDQESNYHFLQLNLTPVPIPTSAWLFGSGLIALAGGLRRNPKSS